MMLVKEYDMLAVEFYQWVLMFRLVLGSAFYFFDSRGLN